ncbi:hypothetical protein FZC19_24415 [Escherichia coli]|nr:hypothetical protein [Escherichia coli]
MAFFYVHYVLIYHTVTSLTYVFVPLDFRPLIACATTGNGCNTQHYQFTSRSSSCSRASCIW